MLRIIHEVSITQGVSSEQRKRLLGRHVRLFLVHSWQLASPNVIKIDTLL